MTDSRWPSLPLAEWQPTRDTLHMWTQIVGKVRLGLEPPANHWWQSTLYVCSRGLTTGLMPSATGGLQLTFDFHQHLLELATPDGDLLQVGLYPRSVADFHGELMARLKELDVVVPLVNRPVEVEVAIPFDRDTEHASYDPAYVHRFWRVLVSADAVLRRFRGEFLGKASPVHFFWGSFDLAVTRFSGRRAPRHPGGVPNCPDWVMHEAYSHELSSCGYWPGGAAEGVFYSYAYPTPAGFAEQPVRTPGARWDTQLGEFLLPYEDLRTARDPGERLLHFLQETYAAAADLAAWPRGDLER